MEKLSLVVDYIEGRVEPAIFEQMLCEDVALYDFLQSLVPCGKEIGDYDVQLGEYKVEPYTINGIIAITVNANIAIADMLNSHVLSFISLFRSLFLTKALKIICIVAPRNTKIRNVITGYLIEIVQ